MGSANDVQKLHAMGGLMSHEAGRTAPRAMAEIEKRLVELRLPSAQYARLVEMARAAGRTPAAYAGDLFQAAYSARCKPTGDAALDAAVARLSTEEAASGPAIEMLQAELARADARIAEMADEIEALSAGAAVSVDAAAMEELAALRDKAAAHAEAAAQWKSKALEFEAIWCDAAAERDIAQREVVEQRRQLETALAGQQDAERRAATFADQADAAHGRLDALHEALQALGEEVGVEPGSERIEGLRGVFQQQAEAIRELMARVDALKNGDDARSASPPPADGASAASASAAAALTPLELRRARSLRAAGNSFGEIAAALGRPAAAVRVALGGK
jgi:hypothetical protein